MENNRVREIIEYENESSTVDFKKEEYVLGNNIKKYDIVKDFIAFANNSSDEDKYIIIGVEEKEDKTKVIHSIEKPTDDAKYQQIINENIEPSINFEYRCISYEDKRICYFRLFNNTNRPYLISKNSVKLNYGDGFIRKGTSTSKLGLSELNQIIGNKAKYKNRHNDIRIIPVVRKYENKDNADYRVLDVHIENISNRSINLHVEMSFKKTTDYLIVEENYLMQLLKEDKRDENRSYMGFNSFDYAAETLSYINFVDFELRDGRLFYSIAKPLNLLQNKVETQVFNSSIILAGSRIPNIDAEIVIRSDDFTNGALVKRISFSLAD